MKKLFKRLLAKFCRHDFQEIEFVPEINMCDVGESCIYGGPLLVGAGKFKCLKYGRVELFECMAGYDAEGNRVKLTRFKSKPKKRFKPAVL